MNIAEVSAKKTIVIDGEHQTLEISSCQWQANTWLEIKNQTIKCSQGYPKELYSNINTIDIVEIYVHLPTFWKCYEIENNPQDHLQHDESERKDPFGMFLPFCILFSYLSPPHTLVILLGSRQ